MNGNAVHLGQLPVIPPPMCWLAQFGDRCACMHIDCSLLHLLIHARYATERQ
jgi:hypothetical protein